MAKSMTYEDYYKKYMEGTDTSAYDALAQSYAQSVDTDAQTQISDANKTAQGNLKQAYITKMQDQRTLNDNLAAAGIRGGASETSNIKLATNYGNTRNTINSQLASSVDTINRTATQAKLAYQQDIDAKKQAYIENRQAEARQAAREQVTNDYNRSMEEQKLKMEKDQIKYEREQAKRTQDIEKYTAWASKYYDTKKLKKELAAEKKKKNPNKLKIQVINARLGYLKSPEYKQAKKAAKK